MSTLKCPFCLSKVAVGNKRCPYCAQSLVDVPTPVPAAPYRPSSLPVKRPTVAEPVPVEPVKGPLAYLQEGVQAFKAGQLDEARAAFEQALALKVPFPEAQNALGTLCFMTGETENAYELFREVVAQAPANPHFLFNLSSALFGLKRYDEGMTTARQVLRLAPHHGGAQALVARYAEQVAVMEWADSLYTQAYTLFELQDFEAAIGQLTELCERQPEHPQAVFLLGRAYVRTGNVAQAQATLAKALTLMDTPEVAHELAKVAMLQQDWPAAVSCLTAALLKAPNNADLAYTLGLAYERQACYLEALVAFERTWQRVPGHHNALYKHAQMLALLGRKREALERLHLLLAHAPEHEAAHQLLRDLNETIT